eukprot:2167174-Rhodomonas_salina.2
MPLSGRYGDTRAAKGGCSGKVAHYSLSYAVAVRCPVLIRFCLCQTRAARLPVGGIPPAVLRIRHAKSGTDI